MLDFSDWRELSHGHGAALTDRTPRWALPYHRSGNERKPIYGDDPDRAHLLEHLAEASERFGIRVYAGLCLRADGQPLSPAGGDTGNQSQPRPAVAQCQLLHLV
jgi:hypothetical protein